MQKYSCEFGLGVYCSYKTLMPVEGLKELEKMMKSNNRYHIYFILSTPKISITNISVGENGINFNLIRHLGECDECIEFQNEEILFHGLDYRNAEVSTKYPYNKLNIKFDKEYLKNFYNDNIKGKYDIPRNEFMSYKNITIDSQKLFEMLYLVKSNTNEMEVLYVGKAYGGNGNRNAFDRLKTHETLQKILIDCNTTYPHKRIYILLLEMTTQLFSAFNGISKEFICSDEDSDSHLKEVLSTLPKENQVINITEAAIINYFKPTYNTIFVNNFPSVKHTGYRQYYDLDYNCLTVELDMTFNYIPYLQLYTETNRLRNPFESINYNLFNDPNRSNMNDIFAEEVKTQ